ncbi:MAG TPA: hypothetical protein VD837_10050 [Terriglobales bacterium]|nr:hypothetical protein [Terriglobales bacterium]
MRYPVRAAVLFSWTTSGELRRGAGFTHDLSITGAYVVSESGCDVQVGQQVWLEGVLPPLVIHGEGMSFRAQGVVVRKGSQREQPGFAVMADLEFAEKRSVC